MKQKKGTRRKYKNKSSGTQKKMNCNPAVKNKTISKNTCYTRDALLQLRDSYNQNHDDNNLQTIFHLNENEYNFLEL